MNGRWTRRDVIAGIAGVGAFAPGLGLQSDPQAGPLLFLDDSGLEEMRGVERVVTPPTKLPEPIVTGPEDKCFQPYMTILRNRAASGYRIWYGVPESASQSHVATMVSRDGVRWQRPHRVLEDPGRIQFGVSVIDDAGREPDPRKRFKLGWWDDGGLQVAASPDGLTWTRLAPGPVLRHNHDINSIHWDPIRKRYIALVSSYTTGSAWKGQRRIPMQSVSDDLVHWRKPWTIITPDARDEGETQFYCMSGLIARGDLLIGLVKVLRDDLKVDNAPPGGYGLGYTTLAWSRDGENWVRDRVPFIDRSHVTGAWDHAMAWGDCQLPVGSETFIYYGGYARGHKVERFTERQIGLARMPRDRYIALRAGANGACILTRPLRLWRGRLTVNADLQGDLVVRALPVGTDRGGLSTPAVSAPVRGAGVALPVSWSRSSPSVSGGQVCLEIFWSRGSVWGIDVSA